MTLLFRAFKTNRNQTVELDNYNKRYYFGLWASKLFEIRSINLAKKLEEKEKSHVDENGEDSG